MLIGSDRKQEELSKWAELPCTVHFWTSLPSRTATHYIWGCEASRAWVEAEPWEEGILGVPPHEVLLVTRNLQVFQLTQITSSVQN